MEISCAQSSHSSSPWPSSVVLRSGSVLVRSTAASKSPSSRSSRRSPIPEADAALQDAIQLADQGQKEEAIEAYLAVRKTYPETIAGQDALYRAGVLYFEEGDYANARSVLNELLFENPLHEKANDARLKSGLSALELGAYRDAYQTLNSLAQRVAGHRAAAGAGGRRARRRRKASSSARRSASPSSASTRRPRRRSSRRALDRVVTLVEGQVPFVEVARVAEELSPAHPALAGADVQARAHLLPPARLDTD